MARVKFLAPAPEGAVVDGTAEPDESLQCGERSPRTKLGCTRSRVRVEADGRHEHAAHGMFAQVIETWQAGAAP